MKRFVSDWNMCKSRNAFTLMEVMVSVMIISVVIMALLKMSGNNSFMLSKLFSRLHTNQYASYLLLNYDYGFEKKSVRLSDLLGEFIVEDDLRRELKNIKLQINYDEIDSFSDTNSTDDTSSDMVLEIGKTTLDIDKTTLSLVRLRVQ